MRLQQIGVGDGNRQQHVILLGLVGKAGLFRPLARSKVIVDALRYVQVPLQAGDGDRSGGDGVGPRPDVKRAALHVQDVTARLLQIAGVRVVVAAQVKRREYLGGRQLLDRDRFFDALAGNDQLEVLRATQAQGRAQIDRPPAEFGQVVVSGRRRLFQARSHWLGESGFRRRISGRGCARLLVDQCRWRSVELRRGGIVSAAKPLTPRPKFAAKARRRQTISVVGLSECNSWPPPCNRDLRFNPLQAVYPINSLGLIGMEIAPCSKESRRGTSPPHYYRKRNKRQLAYRRLT